MIQWEKFLWFASYILVSAGLCAFGLHKVKILYQYWRHRRAVPRPPGQFDELPRITVQLPIFNEGDVLGQLFAAVSALDYPRDRLQIQVLDDSTDETTDDCEYHVREMRRKGFDIEYRHRTNRHGFKAGALAEAMATVSGEFICIFDADFQPASDFLKRTIHHFTDPAVGIVQARWIHQNQKFSLLTRLQAVLLDGHLMLEQTARSRRGDFCNFNGTAGLWRREVIDEAGGWRHDTLTEDLDLSYRAQLLGWRFVYLNDVLVPAELPPDMDGFKSQQHRWTKGSVQVCKKVLGDVWRSDVPLMKKIEATAHLTTNFVNLLTVCTLVLLYPADFLPQNSWQKALFVDLPVFLFATVAVIAFYLSAQGAQRPWAWLRTIPLIPFSMALGIGMSINNGKAVLEAVLGLDSEFVRTPKYGVNSKAQASKKSFRYKAGKSICLWVELALVGYFGHLAWLAVDRAQWGSLPFLLLFLGGFLYVSTGSLFKRFSMGFSPPTPAAAVARPSPQADDAEGVAAESF